MPIVYRVENSSGNGPYYGGGYNIIGYHSHENGRPSFWYDKKLFASFKDEGPGKYHFGFVSLIQLFKWFEDVDREQLSEIGFKISVYDVPEGHLKIGDAQVCFIKEKSRFVMNKRLSIYPRKKEITHEIRYEGGLDCSPSQVQCQGTAI